MSHKATNWAVQVRGIKPTAKVVLWHLADRHNKDTGQCDPSQELLAYDCEISRSSLNNQLDILEEKGFITRKTRFNSDTKRKKTTSYILNFGVTQAQYIESRVQNLDKEAVSKKTQKPCPKNGQSRVQNLDINPVREPVREPCADKPAQQIDDDFFIFWGLYPKPTESRKAKAKSEFSKAINAGVNAQQIIRGAEEYAKDQEGNLSRFIKNPENWLSGKHWMDFERGTAKAPKPWEPNPVIIERVKRKSYSVPKYQTQGDAVSMAKKYINAGALTAKQWADVGVMVPQ